MSAFAILISFQLHQQHKRRELAILLYQQIFLFSFLLYGIWGNIALKIILQDISLSSELNAKLSVFVPMIGLPFMLVSWFMLLRLAASLNSKKSNKLFSYIYFPTLVVTFVVVTVLIHNNIIKIPVDADLFIIRILAGLNLLVHIIFVVFFLLPGRRDKMTKELGFGKTEAAIFIGIVVLYTAAMSFFNVFGFISICISIALVFAAGIFIPFTIRYKNHISDRQANMDFNAFCMSYEISKREAEIILEICSGKTNKAIAEKLFITLQTVKDHNHRIFTKTGVKSRVQLSNLVREKTGKQV